MFDCNIGADYEVHLVNSGRLQPIHQYNPQELQQNDGDGHGDGNIFGSMQ